MSDSATRALTGQRTMSLPIPPLYINFEIITQQWEFLGRGTQWQIINPVQGSFGYHAYVDTSGYNMDDLTIMFDSIGQLEAGRTQLTNLPSTRMFVVDLVTTQSLGLTTAEWDTLTLGFVNNIFPGGALSDYDFEHVQYGRCREYIPVTQGTAVSDVYSPITDTQFGSLESTTADKLHVYRFCVLTGFLPTELAPTLRLPASRMVLNTQIVQEPEIPYLFRQKRSFELQQ